MSSLRRRPKPTGSIATLLHTTRVSGAVVAAAFFAIVSVVWRWPAGALITGIAVLVLLHAVWRRRTLERVSMDVFMVDATAIAAMVLIIEPPMVILVAPVTSIIVAAMLSLPGRQASIAIGYSLGLIISAASAATVYSHRVWSASETIVLTLGVAVVFLPHMALLLRQAARAEAERDESTTRLAEREDRYQSLVEGLPVGVYRTAVDGTILDINQALIDMLGFPNREALLATPLADIYVDEADRADWVSEIRRTGTVSGRETRLRRRDGTTIWVRDTGRALCDASGDVIYHDGAIEDITEQVRLAAIERALSRSATALLTEGTDAAVEEALETILEAAAVETIFVERNLEDPVLGLCSRLVYEASREPERVDYDRWSKVPWSKMPKAYAHLSRGEPFAFRVDELEGEEAALYEGLETDSELDVPIFFEDEWLGMIGFAEPSSRVWTEDDIGVLQVVGQMLAHAWHRETQHQRLEHLVKSRDDFIASVSHRLRTPLTAVVGSSSLLREGASLGDDEREELIDALAEQSLEVANVVEDLLIAARADIGTMRLSLRAVPLRSTVESAIGSLPEAVRSAITVEGPDVEAWADQHRVRQVVRHLLDNAQRYGGSSVSVTLSNGAHRVRLIVADDGPGLPADHARFFEPFESVDVGLPPGQLGIGLSIAQRLAAMMDGNLTYRRTDDRSEFSLELPRA